MKDDGLGWFAIVRLGAVQASIGAIVMLATSLLNCASPPTPSLRGLFLAAADICAFACGVLEHVLARWLSTLSRSTSYEFVDGVLSNMRVVGVLRPFDAGGTYVRSFKSLI